MFKSHAPSVRLSGRVGREELYPSPPTLCTGHAPSTPESSRAALTASQLERKPGPCTFPERGVHPVLPVGTREVHMVTSSSRPCPHWADRAAGRKPRMGVTSTRGYIPQHVIHILGHHPRQVEHHHGRLKERGGKPESRSSHAHGRGTHWAGPQLVQT